MWDSGVRGPGTPARSTPKGAGRQHPKKFWDPYLPKRFDLERRNLV